MRTRALPYSVAFLATAMISLVATSAHAQGAATTAPYVEKKVEEGTAVWFPEDTLGTSGPSMYGDTIRRPPGVIRVGLLRPRVRFIPQMLKSVENL